MENQEKINTIDEDTIYFAPDAKEKIQKALEERQKSARPRNRAERRALIKKIGKKNLNDINVVAEMAQKLDYIDLIQKFRELNKKKENEVYEDEQATED